MSIRNRIKNEGLLGVAPEELKTTLVSFSYIFCIICSYYVLKPIRGSLGIELGKNNLPIMNFLSMFVLILSNAVYSMLAGLYRRDVFIPFITRFFAGCIVVFWFVFSFIFPADLNKNNEAELKPEVAAEEGVAAESTEQNDNQKSAKVQKEKKKEVNLFKTNLPRAIAISVYYLWVGVFILFAVSMFWSFMNDIFTVSQSKRLYAIIGYGGLIGGVAGSFITSTMVDVMGTANLLLLGLVLLYPSVWCMKYVHNRVSADNEGADENLDESDEIKDIDSEKPRDTVSPADGFLVTYRTPILVFMAFEMFFFTFTSTLFYQQLYEMVNQVFSKNTDGATEFFAGFYGKITVLSLFSQFFLTKLAMKLPNPVWGLFIFPVIQVTATGLMLYDPSLSYVSWGLILGSAISYSTGRAIKELVYIPLNRDQKYQGKGFIDTVVFRIGDGISAVILIGGLNTLGYGQWIDFTILAAMAIQAYVIMNIARRYAERVRENSLEKAIDNAS
ncbi:MAG: NTP/NDP exchange transporter [Candidatus Rifleibacteriota bacterium]